MTLFSVSSLLNQATSAVGMHHHNSSSSNNNSGHGKTHPQRPAVLDISSLLNGDQNETRPALSLAREPSPVGVSFYPSPMLPSIADTWPAMLSTPGTCLPLPKPFAVQSDHHGSNNSSSTNNRNSIWMHDSMASSVSSLASTSSSGSDASSSTTPTPQKFPLKKQRPLLIYDSSSEMSDHVSFMDDGANPGSKGKRRRANVKQLEVLNRVFEHTVFPSTQVRAELGQQLGMSPRTVQIWFQNKRQAIRTRERQRLHRVVRDESIPAVSSN